LRAKAVLRQLRQDRQLRCHRPPQLRQSKYQIALEQVRRALANGVSFAWFTADEWYASAPEFLAGLETLGQRYVVEIRRSFHGWLCDPRNQTRAVYRDVETLSRYSRAMLCQPWQRVYLQDTEKGPMVWEVKWAPFWLQRADQVRGPYWLIYPRNVLDPSEAKYFLANAAPGTPDEIILHIAFARWPIERCLEDEKDELGLSHFEVRKYGAFMRHLSVTQVSHLFLAQATERLRGENPEITLCQAQTAANALIDALPLYRRDRTQRLERASRKLIQDQQKIAQARRSHTQTRLTRLAALGINLAELPCCIPK